MDSPFSNTLEWSRFVLKIKYFIFSMYLFILIHTLQMLRTMYFVIFAIYVKTVFFLLQIVSHEGTKIKDPDNREEEKKDDTIIKRTQKIIKSMFRGMKTEPSIVETCIYTVS